MECTGNQDNCFDFSITRRNDWDWSLGKNKVFGERDRCYAARIKRQYNIHKHDAKAKCKKRHDNSLKILAVKWTIDNDLLPERAKLYNEIWSLKIWRRNQINTFCQYEITIENKQRQKKKGKDWKRSEDKCVLSYDKDDQIVFRKQFHLWLGI